MKKIMVALLMVALIGGGAFAGDRFTVTAEVEGNLLTTTSGAGGTTNSESFTALNKADGDFELEFKYDGDAYGGQLTFEGLDASIKNANAWLKFGEIAKVTAGLGYDYRAIGQVGGDADFGAQFYKEIGQDPTKGVEIGTTDPFLFGSGLLVNIFAGPAEIGIFADYGNSVKAIKTGKGLTGSGKAPNWFGDYADYKNAKPFSNYTYGVSAKYESDLFDAGAALKLTSKDAKGYVSPFFNEPGFDQEEFVTLIISGSSAAAAAVAAGTTTVGEGTYPFVSTDFGVYGKIRAVDGLEIGVGVAGQDAYQTKEKDQKVNDPFRLGINLDAKYTGIENLTVGLYNNASFWTYPGSKKDIDYGEFGTSLGGVKKVKADTPASYFYLFDELNAEYKLSDTITLDARVRNYAQTGSVLSSSVGVDYLVARAGVTYAVDEFAKVWARVQLGSVSYSTSGEKEIAGWANVKKADGSGKAETSRDHITFSIPVGIQVKF
jgi:hypothetical protein